MKKTLNEGLRFLPMILLLTFISCEVEEEDVEPVDDVDTEIQAALDAGEPIQEIIDEYSEKALHGKNYEGGIIAFVDDSQLLIIASQDIASDQVFSNQNFYITGTSIDFGRGERNTLQLIEELGSSGNVAATCRAYSGGGFSDWFLPSRAELSRIRDLFKAGLISFPGGENNAGYYWQSTLTFDGTCAIGRQLVTGTETPCLNDANVRPARLVNY